MHRSTLFWRVSRYSGTTVAAYYYADKTWNRGVVMAILSPGETKHSNFLHQERALVLFLDYGNAEKCPLNHIRKLTNCFTVFNAQVYYLYEKCLCDDGVLELAF